MQALSPQNRLLVGLVAAVESGIALWYLTKGHLVNGAVCAIGVAFLAFVSVHGERKLKRQDTGRRY